MSMNKKDQELTFEESLARLEEIVQTLEVGDLPLEEATKLYEKGMRLARICNEKLEAADLRITHIETTYGEQLGLPDEARDGTEL